MNNHIGAAPFTQYVFPLWAFVFSLSHHCVLEQWTEKKRLMEVFSLALTL